LPVTDTLQYVQYPESLDVRQSRTGSILGCKPPIHHLHAVIMLMRVAK
jgi:hypothetical protein